MDGPVAGISATALQFGRVDCGNSPNGSQSLLLTNTGGMPLNFTATVTGSSLFTLTSAASGSVGPGMDTAVLVRAGQVPASSTAGMVIRGSLDITTSDPNNPTFTVPITLTPRGATLVLAPSPAAFGLVANHRTHSLPLSLSNTGNASVSVTFGTPLDAQFALITPTQRPTLVLGAGATEAGLAATFAPTGVNAVTSSLPMQTQGAICGASASSVAFSGQGYPALPLEVLGAVGTRVTLPFAVTSAPAGAKLRFECHGCGFNDAALDGNANVTKAQLSINGGAAVPIKRYTAKKLPNGNRVVVGNAQLVLSPTAEAYGGIGGGYKTVRIELPALGLSAGLNTVTFEYAQEAPGSLGFRIVSLDVVDASGTTLLQNPIEKVDPSTWTPGSPADAAQGAIWWGQRNSLYEPILDDLDGQRGGGPLTGFPIRAACSDCHASDGRDLKYFNYSNKAITARAQYHGLTATQGAQIAAYIRSLPVPYAPKGRPWNPPYQPGPGLDAQPVVEWAAGAGLEAVLETDAQMQTHLFPAGVPVATVASRLGTLNLRELPLALQMPDWNQWLPKIHPLDGFDPAATVITSNEAGTPVAGPYFEVLYQAARANPTPANITAIRKKVEPWLDRGASCYTQDEDGGPAWRAANSLVLGEVALPPVDDPLLTQAQCRSSNPDQREMNDALYRYNISRMKRLETAKDGLIAFISVKQWELMHSNQLETGGAMAGRNTCIPRTSTNCLDASEPRGWNLEGFNVFMRAPHYAAYNSNNFTYQDLLSGTYESTAWYHLQLIINPGYRRNPSGQSDTYKMPSHFPYTVLFVDNLAEESGIQDGFRYWATYIKIRQQQTNGYYGLENGLDLRTAQPFYLYSNEFADTSLRASVGPGLWSQLVDAMLLDLVADASNATQQMWNDANQLSVVQRGDDPPNRIFCAFPNPVRGNVFPSPGRDQGCNTFKLVPQLRTIQGLPTGPGSGFDALITWSKGMWPSSNPTEGAVRWDALR